MATALEIAKQLMTYDTNDSDLVTKINNCSTHAEQKLIDAIGKDNYIRYSNGLSASDTGIAITEYQESFYSVSVWHVDALCLVAHSKVYV